MFKTITENQTEGLYKEEVTREDIAEVVAKWTGIPVMKMLQGEEKNCLNWKMNCIKVVGQEEAIQAVSDAVRNRAGFDMKNQWEPFFPWNTELVKPN
jgi:ATP-dependent Clp protease ATP-binding subunit ClpB